MVNHDRDEDTTQPRYKTLRRNDRSGFATRLYRLMTERGWNQAELSRRTQAHDPREGNPGIGRDMISNYIRARNLPDPLYVKILADTFGVAANSLIPSLNDAPATAAVSPPIELRTVSADRAHLKLNIELPTAIAVQVLALVQSAAPKTQ